jgi:hypothetical protein
VLTQDEEIVEVTSKNEQIGQTSGAPHQVGASILRLVAVGGLTWNEQKPTSTAPVLLVAGGKPISELVLEDRG